MALWTTGTTTTGNTGECGISHHPASGLASISTAQGLKLPLSVLPIFSSSVHSGQTSLAVSSTCALNSVPVGDCVDRITHSQHVLEDFEPYFCIVDDCDSPFDLGNSFSGLLDHLQAHSLECYRISTSPGQFKDVSKEDFEQYLEDQVGLSHDDCETMRDLCRHRDPYLFRTCPFCGGYPDEVHDLFPEGDTIAAQIELRKHIKNHMHDISLIYQPHRPDAEGRWEEIESRRFSENSAVEEKTEELSGITMRCTSPTCELGDGTELHWNHTVEGLDTYEPWTSFWPQSPPYVDGNEMTDFDLQNDEIMRHFIIFKGISENWTPDAERRSLSRTSYHVAWICPEADLELVPAVLMLDERHEPPDIDNTVNENIYEFGSAAGHNIVLASCHQSMTGNINVSSITATLFKMFPNIRMVLFVGICGGVPQPDLFSYPLNDLRLGDVVVGWPTSADRRGPGIYHQYGRSQVDEFEITGTIYKLHTVVSNALPLLKLDHDLGQSTFHEHMAKLQSHGQLGGRFKHPGLEHDKLFQPHYKHVGDYTSNCKDCDRHKLVERIPRDESLKDLFIYHQGRIAIGNSVIIDGEKRDSISEQGGQVLCIEMEAAGVKLNSRYLVIRGISDYADSHKSNRWRSYAAAKAVVFARELLGKIPVTAVKGMILGQFVFITVKHW